MRQYDRADHGDKQHKPGRFKQEEIVTEQDCTDAGGVRRIEDRRRCTTRNAEFDPSGLVGADAENQLRRQDKRNDDAEREVLYEPGAQFGEINVEHHHHEEEQHGYRADINDDQECGDELRTDQNHQAGRVEEREDQPKHRVHRVTRHDDHDGAGDDERSEKIKGERLDHDVISLGAGP